ncbi:MAG: class I SAM-dependent methyltransferase [Candidatus Glassbacteria bacterium]|nr:class I SAM-dependent methyltransferase [Candidatus Glassbacteria bacterium]
MTEQERSPQSLAGKEYWDSKSSSYRIKKISFSLARAYFFDEHRIFRRTLPRNENFRLLEVGCYPGRLMWYFHKYFGYRVCGLEYLERSAGITRRLLAAEGVEAEVIHTDFFSYQPPAGEKLWDVVLSFGFIEHYENWREVIKKHLDLVAPGGYLVLSVPNLRKPLGKIMQVIAPESYAVHTVLGLGDLVEALRSTEGVEILEAAYCGGAGLRNTGIGGLFKNSGKAVRFIYKVLLFGLEATGQFLPNSPFFSPGILVVARKKPAPGAAIA